ncbi:MAG: sugar-binding domain-containing protein [Oscillospiraceae bacterium]
MLSASTVFPRRRRYRRSFRLPEASRGRVLLHFGAVDQIAEVWVNGAAVGRHTGGYFPFTLDITDCLQDENTLLVRVEDHLSNNVLPYGKQKHERGGIWYTPVSGIWQTVWLESVPEAHIRAVRIDAAPERVALRSRALRMACCASARRKTSASSCRLRTAALSSALRSRACGHRRIRGSMM